ncbi:MAG: hypothetical protein Tsb0021_01800 [Chlamydiales bacterium]
MPLPMFRESQPKPTKSLHVLGIASGKGGVGKSTVTVNLARALKSLGYKVGVLDADIYGPSLKKMLPEDRMVGLKDQKFIPALASGISLMSLAYFRQEDEAAIIRAPVANSLIQRFLKEVDWGELDVLLIDFPPGTGDVQLTLSQQANLSGALLVTTPQEISIMDVKKSIHMFQQVSIPIIGILENMSFYQRGEEKIALFGREGGKRLAHLTGYPFLGEIPVEPGISECSDRGASLFEHYPQSLSAQLFLEKAQLIIQHLEELRSIQQSCLQEFNLIWKEMH